jgi:hypothetical protein
MLLWIGPLLFAGIMDCQSAADSPGHKQQQYYLKPVPACCCCWSTVQFPWPFDTPFAASTVTSFLQRTYEMDSIFPQKSFGWIILPNITENLQTLWAMSKMPWHWSCDTKSAALSHIKNNILHNELRTRGCELVELQGINSFMPVLTRHIDSSYMQSHGFNQTIFLVGWS